ncbi:YppE family protein [Kurthia sibirica]|uniref:DUF1798 domain-containing protein n=1 Tax=Kurthia sibirica TaxID=202750 RepID=A0A2U3AI70_9BACL|nr:YppE family protein [Kurthia sibirica]PWI24220.1 DUF1798 domain-containing protein [Kurthia sibirica]GEK34117.1 hypothetical protein KSI01_16500 [Kurthia sibirica]
MLKQITTELYKECDISWERFMMMREKNLEPDFFQEVKPYADHIQEKLKQWQDLSQQYIIENRPKWIHMVQINNACDAIEQFVVQSFYQKTSKKRFYQSIQSVKYTCETYLRFLNEEIQDD